MGQPPPPSLKPEGKLVLHSFKIAGNKIVSARKLKKELSVKLPPSPFLFWQGLPTFRPEDLEYDVERMKDYYRRQGFYHTKVTPEIHYGPAGEVDVKIIIEEGPWVKVTRLEVHVSNGGAEEAADLKKKWPLTPGDRYTEEAYDALKKLYLNYFPIHGYPKVGVTGRIELDEEENTAEVDLKVETGPKCYFGPVRLKDPEKLETPVAAIMEKITVKPGEVFNLNELFKSQRNLYATDLFRSVVLTPETVSPGETSIPIDVALEEKKKRGLKFGLGYGDEEKVRARLGFKYRNLLGGGRMLDVDSRYSALGYVVEEIFTNPVFLGTKFDYINQSAARRRELPGFTDQAYYTQNRLERDFPYDCRFYVGHGLEFSRPFDIPLDSLLRLQGTQAEKLYRASYMMIGVRRDTMDDHINPQKGGIFNFGNEFAPSIFGSNLQYLQTVVEFRRYHALADTHVVLASRLKFGVIEPIQNTSDIPIYRRFFSGGANSVRGYQLDFLGPRNATGQPIGGDAVLEGSLECRFPLPLTFLPEPINQKIGGVAFFDFGNVFLKPRNLDLGELKYAPGVGLRYLSPIGAVGIDVGFPVNRINYQKDRPYQIHFSVGYGF